MFSWINPKIEVGDAGQKGKGLFAQKFIQREEVVVVFQGKIIETGSIEKSEYKNVGDHCFQIEKDLYLCPAEPDIKKMDNTFYFNHSCEPNCGVRGQVTFVTMRDIQPSEEITFDYAMTDNFDFRMECFCGSYNCRKVITGHDWLKKDLQEKYRDYFSRYLQEMIDTSLLNQ
ncbi:MAG: SET domain-containing protein-lysine N-methyltransferase [Parcubacteria group bacterium]|nr:SET domain-containing protein-lysine N-methyltransferase [Parcubacteria group bacterium]